MTETTEFFTRCDRVLQQIEHVLLVWAVTEPKNIGIDFDTL